MIVKWIQRQQQGNDFSSMIIVFAAIPMELCSLKVKSRVMGYPADQITHRSRSAVQYRFD